MKKNLTDGLPIVLRQCCQRSSSLLVLLQREHLVLQPLVLGIQGRHTLLQGDPLVLHRGLHLEKGLTEGRGGYGGVGSRRQNSFNDKKIKPVPIQKLIATSLQYLSCPSLVLGPSSQGLTAESAPNAVLTTASSLALCRASDSSRRRATSSRCLQASPSAATTAFSTARLLFSAMTRREPVYAYVLSNKIIKDKT